MTDGFPSQRRQFDDPKEGCAAEFIYIHVLPRSFHHLPILQGQFRYSGDGR